MNFESFPKIPRLKRNIVITEKIDGTNAQIFIPEDPSAPVGVGSRNRFISPQSDNMGFARWVHERMDDLRTALGPGRHFGEWWGAGIQRRYGLTEKRFSLFNSARWSDSVPKHCHVVPVLYRGPWSEEAIESCLDKLRKEGSVAAPGFMNPEGIVVYHAASGGMFKVTLDNDAMPKGLVSEAAE